jgi:two-component sensor histidine kinase
MNALIFGRKVSKEWKVKGRNSTSNLPVTYRLYRLPGICIHLYSSFGFLKILWLLLFFFCQGAFAQTNEIDSLKQLFSAEKNDVKKTELIKSLVGLTTNIDLQLGLEYARIGVAHTDKINDKNEQPVFYEMQGRIHANLVELDSASFYFDKAMKGYTSIANKKGQATTWFKIGWVHKKKGEMEEAMQADLKALTLMEDLDDKLGIAGAYSRLSEDVSMQGRQAEALEYAIKTIDICEKNNLKEELVYGYTAAGAASIAMSKHEDALRYFDKAYTLAKSLGFDAMSMCDFMNNRGNALKRLGRYKEALAEYEATMVLAKKNNYTNAITAVTANLGEINLLLENYAAALPFQLETVRLQEKDGDLSNLTENYGHVSTIYEKLGNYKEALTYERKARLMRDSTAKMESDKAMSEMLTRYETGKKEATIASQEKQLSQQRLVQWLSIGLAALLAGFLFFGWRSYKARTVANRLLAAKNGENELLLKEIHHRVKNNLEVVSSLLALQSAQIDDPKTKDAMQEGQNRVQSIGIVHQKLYQGVNLGSIEMKDYFINLSEGILDSFGADKRVTIECAMDTLDLDIDTAVPLGLIVNELLTNTLKYAFPDGQHGKVEIKLQKNADGVLQLQVRDNGVGKSSTIKGTGFGGQLITLLTQQLNGTMQEEIKDGTRISFAFKPAKAA